MGFLNLPEGPVTLANATLPACVLGQQGDFTRGDLHIAEGRISDQPGQRIDMGGAMIFPAFVDMHTHLDKGHIWPRAANPDGTFMGALTTVGTDRTANWTAEDLRRRMEFSLRCAYAHGTRAIRTHLDSIPPQEQITWPVFRELRADWSDKITLQAVSLVDSARCYPGGPIDGIAQIVAQSGGVMGLVTTPDKDLSDRLRHFFSLCEKNGLEADFHVDETGDPNVATLREIALAVIETGFMGKVTVGHCCSLAVQEPSEAARTMDLVARAGLHVVSLPMCNMYLQDRARDDRSTATRTPRWRGVTLVHELKDRGVSVSFSSDNTRDPFYAYGDLDMLEVIREATRIAHLDHSDPDWLRAFTLNPALACGFEAPSLAPGAPADLVICKARNWTELLARPQSDRVVLRAGQVIDTSLPDYAELDDLMELS
ncbi:MAG: cytosine deaminase [Mangrovicoccus sp.]|nr:cytosine deaminase [Mangrovicoccus sp.]